MKKSIWALCLIVGSSALVSLHAADKTTVINQTKEPITAYFKAWGCFGVKKIGGSVETRICETKRIPAGRSASYKWKDGQSGKTLIIEQDGISFRTKGDVKDGYGWSGYKKTEENIYKANNPEFGYTVHF